MMNESMSAWQNISVSIEQLHLSTVLQCGQSFRWKLSGPDEWSCGIRGRILSLKQDETQLHFRAVFPSHQKPSLDDTTYLVKDYLALSIDLGTLYKQWSLCDPNFSQKAPKFSGVRMLRQDPWENLVSFICSSNNNIVRISQMVNKLCITWGNKIGSIDSHGEIYYDFPEPKILAGPGVEQKLRTLGFGYRAKYIAAAAHIIYTQKPDGWLESLRGISYRDAHQALLQLPGVGPKVADCICLMSLDKAEAVPIDTHVLQIAQRDYNFPKPKTKTLTKETYHTIGDYFRDLWGRKAGWAHSVLFAADLKIFRLDNQTSVKLHANSGNYENPTKKRTRVGLDKDNGPKRAKLETNLHQLFGDTLADRIKSRRRRPLR